MEDQELEKNEELPKEASGEVKTGTWLKGVRIALYTLAGLVLVLCLSVVVYWGCIGVESFDEGVASLKRLLLPRANDVYYHNSYSVSDEEAKEERNEVVATVGGKELTNGNLQIYYWMNVLDYLDNYSYNAMYYGLDYTEPLDQQTHQGSGGTWQQHFLSQALTNWHHYQAMALLALEEGLVTEEELAGYSDELRASLAEAAVDGEYSGIDAMLQTDMGAGCTFEDYSRYMQVYYAGYIYFNAKYQELSVSDADIEAWFAANEAKLQEQGITKESGDLKDVRHLLVSVKGGTEDEDGDITYSDEEWETCRTEAQKLLDQWLAGEATEESFALLAQEHSEDVGSNENGGLYEDLDTESGFVPEFIDWYMDESRKVGDYELLRTEYGYHIMYFSGSEPQWIRASRDGVLTDRSQEILDAATERYPMEVTYKKIVLADVDFNQ